MKFTPSETDTSPVEVTDVSKHGFWMLIEDREVFLPFGMFPWFRDAPIGQLLNVTLPQPHHLYWLELDIDLAVGSIDHPEKFPLVSNWQANNGMQPTAQKTRRS